MAKAKAIYVWEHKVKGEVIGEIRRYPKEGGGKNDLPFYNKDGNHWAPGALPAPRPLFGLDSIKDVMKPVIVCEGQKVCSAWHGLGYQAVSPTNGAYSYDKMDWSVLSEMGARVIWFAPDNDAAGEHCMQGAWNRIRVFEPEMKVIRLPDLKAKGDLCDWLKLQPELNDWNELDPLAGHPSRAEIKNRLEDVLSRSVRQIEWSPWDEWKSPLPVDTKLRPVHRMNAEFLPPQIRSWLVDCQKRIGCPLEYLAIASIAAAGAAIGTACTIRPKERDTWAVVPNNFGAIVGPPSTKKTAAISAAIAPLEKIDTERYSDFLTLIEEYEKEKFIYEQKLTALKEEGRTAARAEKGTTKYKQDRPEVSQVADEYNELPKPKEPRLTRSIIKDATKEAITPILETNPRGIIICLDELVQLIAGWEKEGRQGERQFFLQGWNGDQPWTVDRASYGNKGQRLPKLCISIIGGMQPDTLKQYLVDAGENSNDGMIQRFQLMTFLDDEDNLDDDEIDEYENSAAKFEYFLMFKNLASYNWSQYGASTEPESMPFYKFSTQPEVTMIGNREDWDTAQELWNQWRRNLKSKIRNEENPMVQQHLSKYPSLMAGLALTFHCMAIALGATPGPINRECAQQAIDWCEFLEEHARRVYDLSKPKEISMVDILAKKIQEGKLGQRFAPWMVQQRNWKMLKTAGDIMKTCNELSKLNWLRPIHSQNERGGPPKIEFIVNPDVIDDQAI